MLHYPAINPIALQIGFIKVRWYGLMYLIGLLAGWGLLLWRSKKRPELGWTSEQIGDVVFYAALGVVLGGRTGYMLFYDFSGLIQHPLSLFKIWEGGMSFHGGLLGVVGSLAWFCHTRKKSFIDTLDFIAPVVPLGLAAGRIGNFINGELWGRVSTVNWAMVFPSGGSVPRHPSQLYEALLEGVVLFIILWWFSIKPHPRYTVSGLFLLGYGLARFMCEFFREPDWQKGFIAFDWLTMGQVLSLPMIIAGIGLLRFAYWKAKQ